jgi:MFS family permease
VLDPAPAAPSRDAESPRSLWSVIAASSAGTLVEWYDFYIFGSLATVLADAFFPKGNETVALLSTLATFATGFVVRPFGAVVFGRIGDLVGRKYTFLVTLLIMGGATFAIGLLPTYEQIGIFAPIALVLLRLLQGLALGGEYGGAATYVAEHCPDGRRGFYTSFIQTTATLGLFASLGVIVACRTSLPREQFEAWGWRIPFLLSALLVVFSWWIRMRLQESPIFQRMKASGKGSKSPLRDSFGQWPNLRLVLLALFGATAGQGVVWYTGQYYALFFLQKSLSVEFVQTNYILGLALLLGTPFFVVCGALSDRIGRKPVMMAGCLVAILSWLPIYRTMTAVADPKQMTPVAAAPATAAATATPLIQVAEFECGSRVVTTARGTEVTLGRSRFLWMTALVLVQVLFVTMVYGPIAAFLVELFPARIRYTSMSLPYHIGNGVFGGLVPFVGTALVSATKDPYAGLYYPMAVALVTLVVGTWLLPERRDVRMHDEH